MKKLFLFTWMMMLSIVAMAQTIMVIDKDGNRIPYDPEKVSSVDFQVTPPGFTVNHEVGSDLYLFDKVQSVKGLPDYLFVDPKVVHVSLASAEGYEAMFAAEVKTNVEYEVETSDPWIKVARKEADRLVCNVLKHEGNDRTGYVALASKDGLLTDTIKVSINDEYYVLKCLTPVQSITYNRGTARFMLIEIVNGHLRPAAGKTISFTPENGTCSVKEAVTDAQGMVSVDYTPSSDADRGSIQACFRGYFNGISMMYTSTALFAMEKYELKALEPKKYLWEGEDAVEVEFQLMEYDKGTWNPVRATNVYFACENGIGDDISKKTDEEGKVSVIFKPDQDFKEGSVTARCIIQLIDKSPWEGYATTKLVRAEAYSLEALTPEIHLCGDNFGEIPVQFRLLKFDHENTTWIPCADKTIEFTAVNGVAGSTSAVSDVDGEVTVTFKPDQGITEGSLTANCNIELAEGNKWRGEAVTKFITDLYKIERILPWDADAVDYYIGKPWDCEFQLLKKEGNDYVPCPYQYIQFEATNGSCTPDYALTDSEGKVRNTYTMDDDKDNGSLKASFSFTDAEGNVCIGSVMTNFFLDKYDLKCLTPEVEVKQSETVEIRFQLFEYKGRGKWEPCPDKTITFTAKNGICTPEWTKTNAEGIATVRFSPTSTDVTEGVVQAECGITLDPKTGLEWRAAELALITITESYKLECLTKEVEIKKDETADIRFRLMEFEEGKWVTCSGVVNFTAENGTSNPEWMQADDDGLTHATFIPAADATEGTLTGSISIIINDKATITWSDVAHITIIDDGTGDRPLKEKAKPKIRILDEGSGGTKPLVVDEKGNGEIVFVVEERIEGEDADRPVEGAKVEFETDNQDDNLEGFSWATTGKDGKAPATFKIKDFAKFKGVKIKAKATVKYSNGAKIVETTAKVNSDGTLDTGGGEGPGGGEGEIKDEDLKKADKLDDNTYVVDEKKVTIGSNEEDYVYYYYKTDPESDKSVVCIEFCKEHPVYYTVGGGVVHVTPDMIDKEVDMLKEQPDGMAWMNLFTLKDINQGYNSETNPETSVSAGSTEGNAKLEKAVCKVSKDKDGGYTALIYFKTKDGMEAYAKMKAKVEAPWATN